MNKTIAGALFIVIVVMAGALGVKLMLPKIEERHQKATSDAVKTKGKIRIALDNWIGYFPLSSPEMKNLMRRSGYILVCEDDNADYAQRMERLRNGEIEFAVATVDSFILNAAAHNYPGAIIMVIDESKGGDAILARENRVASLDAIKGKTDLRVAFTPNSPSHHLAKAAADHFSVPELLPSGNLRVETDGSEKAREELLAGKVDIAICWEPDVSRVLTKKGFVKILGTEDTERLIVDILIVNRNFVKSEPEVVKLLLGNYFRVLKKYREDPELLLTHVKKETGLSENSVNSMLKGVKWANFADNCEKWFGISPPGGSSEEGLVDTIEATVRILVNTGDFSDNPIPDQDPYRLTNRMFLEDLFARGISGFTKPKPGTVAATGMSSIEAPFDPLDEAGWNALKEIGTLKVEPIAFQHGTTELAHLAKKVVDDSVERLKHYPNFRVIIKGHTGIRGDKAENMRLSQGRAEAVAQYLEVVYNINTNRLRAIGYGGTRSLPRKSGESKRTWSYRLPRVELVLAREDF